ncbi:ADP-ribosyltransferase [Aeromonas phage ST4]|nr:ADP-ribosyltransferase [Aeromonas phage ST4]
MRLLLLKSTKFAHQAGYYLQGGRWHSIKQDKPAPKGAPVSAHPHAAGKPVQKETLAEHEWGQLKLPDTNTNAGTFNKQLDQLKAAAANGDVTGILASGYGTNTYGKKLAIIANHVLGLLGSEHKVTPGQKPGAHAAVQTAQEAKALANENGAQKPEPKKDAEPKFTDKGTLANPSGYGKTFANLKQANAAAEKLKAQGHDVYVTAQHPYQVKLNKPAPEAKKDAALNAAIDHLKEDAKQSDLPAAEQKEDQALVSKLEAAVEQTKQPEQKQADEKPTGAADKLAQIPWDKMLLPDSNKNAKSHNGKVAHIKAMAEAGDIEGLKNFKAGVNTYGKKQNLLAQTALAALEESAAPAAQAPDATPEPAPAPEQSKAGEPTAPIKPEHPAGTPWALHVDKIESFKNNVEWLTDYVENTEVKSESGKSALEYAKALLGEAQATKGDTNDGPQEGETKQGADGMLVFHNGRWHKQGEDSPAAEKPAPATPADVEIPTFEGVSQQHAKMFAEAAEALKAKISAEGKAGFKGVLTNHKTGAVTVHINGIKIGKATITSKSPAFANFAKFVDELKASAGAVSKPKPAPKAATAAPAPAAAPEPAKELESMDHWTQTGGQGGSNPGGKFKDQDGVEWYCKFPADQDTAKAEVLAAKLYTALGLNAQDAKLVTKDGKVGIASRWQEVKKVTPQELAKTPGVLAGFAADAWLANWDVVGLGFDNLQVDEKGNAMRVDAGGSLMYRAQGGKKAFGDTVTELDSLRDKKLNPQAAAVFGGMSQADITASVAKVAQISDAQIRILVNSHGPGTKAERKALADTLIARKNDLLAKYPKAAKQTKKRLDPNNLPVKDDQLPKRHDFANWNGPSQPLSSKAHVNEANQKVEDEVLAIAKTGNLTKLKDYKFQPVDKDSGQPVGEPKPISEHPSKHVVQYHADLVQLLDEIANPPQPLKIFQESDVNTLDELDMAFPPKKFGTTVGAVHSNEKLGFWVVLGGVHGAEKFKPQKLVNFTQQAITSAYDKFKEASKLAKHFVHSVQASGSYNDLFRDGKTHDHSGNKLSDVAQAALEFATEQPEGTGLYRWQNMSDEMVKKIMSAPEGSVFQATGPMCTSYSPTATSGFGKHRVTIRYAKGAKAVESFGSGKFAGEKEITTLPNSRFVILERKMVPSEKGGGERLELEVLMLPPDLGI